MLNQVVSYDPATDSVARGTTPFAPNRARYGYLAVRGGTFYYFAGDGYNNGFPTSTLVGTLDALA